MTIQVINLHHGIGHVSKRWSQMTISDDNADRDYPRVAFSWRDETELQRSTLRQISS